MIWEKPLIEDKWEEKSYRENPIVTNRGSKHKITLSFNISYMSKLPPTLPDGQLLLCTIVALC